MDESKGPGKTPPEPSVKADKTWLSPYLLLMLKNWHSHGYELMQKLMFFGFSPIDQATVYRTLRQLEKQGLIISHWEHAIKGPAKRLYELTEAGEVFLQSCAATMGQYQKMLDQFFRLYTGQELPGAELHEKPDDVHSQEEQEGSGTSDRNSGDKTGQRPSSGK